MFGFNTRYHVCDLFGIPIYLDLTFAIILLTFFFDLPLRYSVGFALLLAISIVLHELGHALTARAFGYRTRDITISLLGGCAAMIALPRKAWQEFLTALAGPLVSFAIALGVFILDVCVPIANDWLAAQLYYLFWLNVTLGSFNLLPALPMDGGRIFRSFLRFFVSRVRATYIAMIVGRVLAVALVVLPLLGVNHLGPIPLGGYFFLRLLIAWMIWQEARREYLLALSESGWTNWSQDDFRARVSPPPYDR